jgi:hypothetical protein
VKHPGHGSIVSTIVEPDQIKAIYRTRLDREEPLGLVRVIGMQCVSVINSEIPNFIPNKKI